MTTTTTPRLKQVGEVLRTRKLITEEQLTEALAAQQQSAARRLLGEVIVELGFCTEIQVLGALADACDSPFVRLAPRFVDPAAAACLPRAFAQDHAVLGLFLVDGVLTVAATEPTNVFLAEEIGQLTGHEVQLVASPRADILATIEAAYEGGPPDAGAMDDILAEAAQAQEYTAAEQINEADLHEGAGDSPVVKLVHQLIVAGVREDASDIHFEPGDGDFRVRYRVDGRLYEKMKPPHQMTPAVVSRVKILAGLDIAERRLPQDGAIRVNVDGRPIDLRVSTLPNRFGEKVVLRILDTQNALIGLERLGMEPELQEAFEAEIRKPHGIVLVTGPTGSGKTTTLYSALSVITSPEVNISTVEDPIEYNLAGINQFQVHERIDLTFPAVLRALLRQDPDVIMLGEIRDPETARIAVQAALTGHLVLSTMHTNDSAGAATRLYNLGVESYLVAAALEGVLAQRLVRRICTHCKDEVDVPPHVQHVLQRMGIEAQKMTIGRGCPKCSQLGTKGRVGLYELFLPNDEIREAIAGHASLAQLRELAVAAGMKTLLQAGLAAAAAGDTSYEEILRVTTV